MMEHTASVVDSRGRCEGEGNHCVQEGIVCVFGGTDVSGALVHILFHHFPLLHSDLVLRHRCYPPIKHNLDLQ